MFETNLFALILLISTDLRRESVHRGWARWLGTAKSWLNQVFPIHVLLYPNVSSLPIDSIFQYGIALKYVFFCHWYRSSSSIIDVAYCEPYELFVFYVISELSIGYPSQGIKNKEPEVTSHAQAHDFSFFTCFSPHVLCQTLKTCCISKQEYLKYCSATLIVWVDLKIALFYSDTFFLLPLEINCSIFPIVLPVPSFCRPVLSRMVFDCQMLEDAPQIRTGVRLSVVQGYMSNFFRSLPCCLCFHCCRWNDFWHSVCSVLFRRYGTWVARHPTLVLCSSLSIVLLLCLGLIRFKVETRPEKVLI